MTPGTCRSCGALESLDPVWGLCISCFSWASGRRLCSPDPEVFFYLLTAVVVRARMDMVSNTEVPHECFCGEETTACAREFVDLIVATLSRDMEPGVVIEALGRLALDAALDRPV